MLQNAKKMLQDSINYIKFYMKYCYCDMYNFSKIML